MTQIEKRPLSEDTQSLLREAYALAREMGHSYVGTEHLMLAMFRREQLAACRVLTRTGWEAESSAASCCRRPDREQARTAFAGAFSTGEKDAPAGGLRGGHAGIWNASSRSICCSR